MEEFLKNSKVYYLSNLWSYLPKIINLELGDQIKKIIAMKTTSNGKGPQNIESLISQQPLIWSSSNFKLKLSRPNQNKNAWNEEDI